MAFKIEDRVKESTVTTGTGTLTLAAAVTNFERFSANLSNSDTTYYAIVDNTNNAFEVGLGTYSSNTLARGTIFASSNSGNKVDLGVGTKEVFITVPASKIVVEDGSNNVSIGGTVTATAFSGSGASLTGVDVVNDTSPQLGGALDVQTHDIVTTSNRDLELAPNGTGKVVVKGNTNQGAIKLNCEVNSHGQTIIAAPHSESASNTLTLPSTGGDARIVSTSSTATLTNKTFGDNVSFGDNNITNVGDIAIDSISADGTDINVAVSDNSATAFTIKQGSDNYLVVDTGDGGESVAIGTGISGTAISIGHTTSETTVNDNLTVTGNLTVSGTTTTVDSTTINIQNAFVFEGATPDAHETTLTTVDPTADRTISLPNQSGTLPVLAAASTTQITSTPEELNLLDGVSGLVQADFTKLAAVDATASELNLLDGGTSVGSSITIADSDGIIVNDGGTMKSVPASDVKTYASADSATKGFATAMAIAL
tara:strand:- start:293 stop:1741 length:1449 start_codon:yes stop_codon:yes gene_type:complete